MKGKSVLLGVSGGIAAYKAAELVRLFVKAEASVQVVMTAAAQQFITPLTFQVLSEQPVCTDLFDLGLESGSQTILDNMDKRLTRQQSFDAVRMLNDYGIESRGSFIIGYPGETSGTFSETLDFINGSGLPYYHPYLFYYTGNTLVHREREALGLNGLGLAWRHHTMDSVEASRLMSQMVERIDRSQTAWEE